MNQFIKRLSLTNWILLALSVGILCGLFLHSLIPEELRLAYLQSLEAKVKSDLFDASRLESLKSAAGNHWVNLFFVDGMLKIGTEIFMRTLKMLVVPLVFVSLVCGVTSLGDPRMLGRIGGRTVGLYILTTASAITLSLCIGLLFGVGKDAHIEADGEFTMQTTPPLSQVFIEIFPTNPIEAMATGTMLQVIFFAILFGLGISLIGAKGEIIVARFKDLNEVMLKMVMMLMTFAPIGVFCVVTMVFAQQGLSPILGLLQYFLLTVLALTVHCFGVYGSLLRFFAGLDPLRFFLNARPAAAMAFSTASSNATIPVTLETAEEQMGVHNSVASFTIPLGATINMDGTSIMQGMATVFIAHAAGIDLSLQQILIVILMATLSSIGTAGVPGAGMITLAMVLNQVGLPEQGILLLLPVDRVLDMCRTVINVCGDLAVTAMVAAKEKRIDMVVYMARQSHKFTTIKFEKKAE